MAEEGQIMWTPHLPSNYSMEQGKMFGHFATKAIMHNRVADVLATIGVESKYSMVSGRASWFTA